jgi:DNA-binding response OmpR family regulator
MVLWLLEDDASVRIALAARLSSRGAQVAPFSRLSELQAALYGALPAPHGLLTDHRLPDGTGLEAIDAVRARHGPLPALVLTGDTGPDKLMQFKTRGAPVVHKPFDQDALLARVAAWKQQAGEAAS